MPGRKSLSKMEKQQAVKEKPKKEESSKAQKNIGRLDIPDVDSKELMEHLNKMKAITPTQLATQLNVRISVANRVLGQLKQMKVVNLVSSTPNLKVYSLNAPQKAS